jgi:hypothetical protein
MSEFGEEYTHVPLQCDSTSTISVAVVVLDRQIYEGVPEVVDCAVEDCDRETENSKVCARTRDTRFILVRAAKVASPMSCLGDQVWRPALGVGLVQIPS